MNKLAGTREWLDYQQSQTSLFKRIKGGEKFTPEHLQNIFIHKEDLDLNDLILMKVFTLGKESVLNSLK